MIGHINIEFICGIDIETAFETAKNIALGSYCNDVNFNFNGCNFSINPYTTREEYIATWEKFREDNKYVGEELE